MNFIHPGFMFAGLAAAALPILIHLMLRQRARYMPIGSVRFLKDVLRQHTRRRRIKQWLLLALRMLAVLLLAMLFARPFFDRSHLEAGNREVILLVDRSASMRAEVDGETALAAATRLARRELARIDPQTVIHAAVFDAGGMEELAPERFGNDLSATDLATDFSAALAWARDIVTVSGRPSRQLILITDLQRSGLGGTTIDAFPGDTEVVIHDVGRTMTQNVAIEDAQAVVTEIRPDDRIRVRVALFNAGALPVKELELSIDVQGPGGRFRESQTVTLAAQQRRSVELPLEIETAGIYTGRVTINRDDELEFDNHRWVAFEARHPDRILLVDGQQGRTVYTNETYFLETALRLRLENRPFRSFEIERIVWEDGDGFPDLAGFKAALMCNVGRWSQNDVRRLADYVQAGGYLLVFAGDQSQPEHFQLLREAGLLSITAEISPAVGSFRVKDWQREHPILAPFADAQYGDLRAVRFRKLLRVTPTADDAEVLMKADASPLLVEQRFGKGGTLLFTSTVDREWTDWPQTRLYVPLVRQIVGYATYQLEERQLVKQSLVDRLGQTIGIEKDGDLTVVRNIDPRESQLTRLTEEEFREAFGLPAADGAAISAELAAAIEPPAGALRADESWTTVMWLLLAVLLAETFVASRIHA